MSIKVIIEEELKGESWGSLKHRDEEKMAKINALYTKCVLKMHLRRFLSDNISYKKQVAGDFPFSLLNYDSLVSKFGANIMSARDMRNIEVNEPEHKLMRTVLGT